MATVARSTEERARDALTPRVGRDLTEHEWTTYRSRLLAYVRLLQQWDELLGSSDDLG